MILYSEIGGYVLTPFFGTCRKVVVLYYQKSADEHPPMEIVADKW
jgi:hypothetical protein